MQERRLESKFVVSEAVAEQLRAVVRKHLIPDEFSTRHPDSCYPVHSLYLDSDELDSYWATIHGNDRRVKLRVRFYEDYGSAPAYVEIKQHADGEIIKQRCPVPREKLNEILAGRRAEAVREKQDNPKHQAALESFIAKVKLLGAAPKVQVAYRREAYVSPDGKSVRLTLDRDIRCALASDARAPTKLRQPRPLCEDGVVVEFKVSGPEPGWFREMAQALNLRPAAFAKYVAAVTQQGLHTTRRNATDRKSVEF